MQKKLNRVKQNKNKQFDSLTKEIFFARKYIEPANISSWACSIKKQGLSIATLNGSFDLLQAGHLYILFEAAKQADILIVALNSDCSIKQYKGEERPIIPLEYRMEMIAALELVDFVTYFHETSPIHFLKEAKPNVHINGIEYGENCLEADIVKKHGGRLHLVNRIGDLSTSNIIKKIKTLCD